MMCDAWSRFVRGLVALAVFAVGVIGVQRAAGGAAEDRHGRPWRPGQIRDK